MVNFMDNFSFDLLLHCHLATASAYHISPISLCICIFINMFLNYQKSTGNDISETVKTNTFRTLIEMRSLNRNVRPPFQETPDQPLLSPEDIMIYDVIMAPKQYFAPGPTKPLGGLAPTFLYSNLYLYSDYAAHCVPTWTLARAMLGCARAILITV